MSALTIKSLGAPIDIAFAGNFNHKAPASAVMVDAYHLGYRTATRNAKLEEARYCREPGERAMLIRSARSWHKLVMKSRRELFDRVRVRS